MKTTIQGKTENVARKKFPLPLWMSGRDKDRQKILTKLTQSVSEAAKLMLDIFVLNNFWSIFDRFFLYLMCEDVAKQTLYQEFL